MRRLTASEIEALFIILSLSSDGGRGLRRVLIEHLCDCAEAPGTAVLDTEIPRSELVEGSTTGDTEGN